MKEYVVLEIKCDKKLTISDVYAKVKARVVHNRNLFFVDSLHVDRMRDSNKRLYNELYDKLNLKQFMYTIILEHRKNCSDYNPAKDDRQLLSNLDESWQWYNPKTYGSLSRENFEELITFFDNLKATDLSDMLMAFDEIAWDGSPVGRGTYGYEKADNKRLYKKNYLSNAVVLSRWFDKKQYSVYITCEKQYRELAVVQELADSLGGVKREVVHFAPEDDAEREEWKQISSEAEAKLEKAMAGLHTLPLEKCERSEEDKALAATDFSKYMENIMAREAVKINIQSYIKDFLCTDGWQKRKALPDEMATVVAKDKGDASIVLGFDILHNGHHVSIAVYYRSKMFYYTKDIACIQHAYPEQIDVFFRNARVMRDYLYESL